MNIEIQGHLERITFVNKENGFTVAKLIPKGQKNVVTITGNMPSVNAGEFLSLSGSWSNHPRFGKQFKVESYRSIIPATAKGIEKYLGSGMIRGIGPVMAKRLVQKFGTETIDIIEKSITRLSEVEGIGEKRIEMIKNAWEEQKEIKDVMLFLQGHGVSPAYAAKIFKEYGSNVIEIVRENPYRLASDIFGIGFLSADRIAKNLGIRKDSKIRAEAGILYVLQQLTAEGHVYYPFEELVAECRKILDTEAEIIKKAINVLVSEKKLVYDWMLSSSEKKRIYLARLFVAEKGIADNLLRLSKEKHKLKIRDIDRAVRWSSSMQGITLAANQKEAVNAAFCENVLVITGGPGTGKTTIINTIIRIFEHNGAKVMLAAPTGRAAKRMSEATSHEARTIHRLLEFSPKAGGFKKKEDNRLKADLIIIDETSMVDTSLMYHLLKAVPVGAVLIFVGDIDQLPSVGPGNVLRDIIDSHIVKTCVLDLIFRQSEESLIVLNAHKINRGEKPKTSFEKGRPQDFYFYDIDDPQEIVEKIKVLCSKKIPDTFGFDPVEDIQVLTAMHRGAIGASNLNVELRNALNPDGDELNRGGQLFRSGDKVMQVVNNYDKEVYNGDMGRILSIDNENMEIRVSFEGKTVSYDFIDTDELVPAYAISVHKSQGSEYPVVIMPVHTQHYLLLQRNLLYTGMTRGKKLVLLLGTKKALHIAINNNKPMERFTYLKERLRKGLK